MSSTPIAHLLFGVTITFLRHATDYKDAGGERHIDMPGRILAARRGALIKRTPRVLVSSAVRAVQTFNALALADVHHSIHHELAELKDGERWDRLLDIFKHLTAVLGREPTPAEYMLYSDEACLLADSFGEQGAEMILGVLETEQPAELLVVGHDFGSQLTAHILIGHLGYAAIPLLHKQLPHCGGFVVAVSQKGAVTITDLEEC